MKTDTKHYLRITIEVECAGETMADCARYLMATKRQLLTIQRERQSLAVPKDARTDAMHLGRAK